MRRREFIAAVGSAVTWPFVAHAQQPALPVVGFLSTLSSAALTGPVAAFRKGLESLGYEEGKNVAIEFTAPDGGNQVVSADHPVAVADKVFENVEDLGLNGDGVGTPTQLASVCIQSGILEEIQQFAAPTWPGRVPMASPWH